MVGMLEIVCIFEGNQADTNYHGRMEYMCFDHARIKKSNA